MNLQQALHSSLPIWQAATVLGPSTSYALAALFARSHVGTRAVWRGARWAANAALVFATVSLTAVLFFSRSAGFGLRADLVGALVMLLVAFVAWVIVRYSQTYLNRELGEQHYVCWLMATLAAVGLVIGAKNLLVLTLAWTVVSLTLHRLLIFFGERPTAVVAAHKKFIVARSADLCMLVATGLLFQAYGTLQINEIVARASALPVHWTAQAAMVLMACAVVLKCAQLPFHGWLIQVMEAPTPVSALLHAGVVNLGGFILIRFAPLVGRVRLAEVLLVVAGTTTAVVASLVMSTRVSIKVMLAWSTCAQMGFMLMECGLGAWEMATLHLVAHSLYKAHSFLSAGGTVRRALVAQLYPRATAAEPLALGLGAVVGLGMTLVAGVAVDLIMPGHLRSPAIWVLALILALALVPLVQASPLRTQLMWIAKLGLAAFGLALIYFGLHVALSTWLEPLPARPNLRLCSAVALAFAILFLLQSTIRVAPDSALVRRLYPWFYGGLFIDEMFSAIAFKLWHPPAPAAVASRLPAIDSKHFSAVPKRFA